jgi:Ni/Fe-hydrogenase b-type cytochrome subunit
VKRVYMYTVYERVWHWLQVLLIGLLLLTGIEIHWPRLQLFDFRHAVEAHNALAFILIANAFLSLFYHLTTGEIRQFIPEPRELFGLMAKQARYYLQGIFRHEPHPLAKDPRRKLNPLQQITYLVLLNFLLPLQVLSGLVMWGAQRYPRLLSLFGGLQTVAAVHTLGAWLLLSFIIAHVYLTTTGHTPLALIKAMVTGWEELEDRGSSPQETEP